MEHCRRQKQIPVQERIIVRKIVAEPHHAECVLQKTAHKAVVNRLRRRGNLEGMNEFLVIHKQLDDQLAQMRLLDLVGKADHLIPHFLAIFFGYRYIFRRIIFSLTAPAGSLDVQLILFLIDRDLSDDVHIVHLREFLNPDTAGLPDLGIDASCFVLENQAVIGTPVLRRQLVFLPAKIDAAYVVAFF